MKKLIFLLAMLLLGLGTTFASDKKGENSNDNVLYEQAVKAIKAKKFALKANQYIDGDDNGKLYNVSPSDNYILVDVDKAIVSCNPIGGKGFCKEGYISNFNMAEDVDGNINVGMIIKNKGSAKAKFNFFIEKGTNRCILTCNPIRFYYKFEFIGNLTSYDTSDLIRDGASLTNQIDK